MFVCRPSPSNVKEQEHAKDLFFSKGAEQKYTPELYYGLFVQKKHHCLFHFTSYLSTPLCCKILQNFDKIYKIFVVVI